MRVDEVQTGRGAPMAQQPGLHVLRQERLAQQRVVHEVDLPHRQVVGRSPPSIEAGQLLVAQARFRRFHSQVVAAHLAYLTGRSEEHTSELQSLMRISYDVFCLTKKK